MPTPSAAPMGAPYKPAAPPLAQVRNLAMIKWLTFMMFMMFAMTTDSVGVIIPRIIQEFHLSMTAAGSFQYATMAGIALAGVGLGFLADRFGRKACIILGLSLFAANALLFAVSSAFTAFLALLFISGVAIGVFKTGALALIGDISRSAADHTSTLNAVEGFFGVGAIIGPAIVASLLRHGASWKWLYVIAGALCGGLILAAFFVRYPRAELTGDRPADFRSTLRMAKSPYALGFSLAAMLYVGVEAAIYVWMPTLLAGYHGGFVVLAAYALSVFFALRAAGRFLGAWMLSRLRWSSVLALCSLAILGCFLLALVGGQGIAVLSLPASGLFMSVIYPTINSKGISCHEKASHGAAAGLILFFTCVSAVLSPLAMGAVSDVFGGPRWGFVFAAGLSALLAGGMIYNWAADPLNAHLSAMDDQEYAH